MWATTLDKFVLDNTPQVMSLEFLGENLKAVAFWKTFYYFGTVLGGG
jgi:hypothetical protein